MVPGRGAELLKWLLHLALVGSISCNSGSSLHPPKGIATNEPSVGPSSPTRFSIEKSDSTWWLISPAGQKFFSLGVCCVNQGTSRKGFDPENPSYAAWQHYDSPGAWANAALHRLKSWGFSTVGGWGETSALCKSSEMNLYLTPVLHVGASVGAPWWDMWDAKNIRRMEEIAREQILPLRDDDRVIGYYSDNELGWWNAALWKMTLEQPASSGQRQRLIQLLRETYRNDWGKLLEDFEPENAANWTQLEHGGALFLKSGGQGIRVMRSFLSVLAERYYQLMRDIIRENDPRALFLGDRYQSFYYPEVASASARYVDAVSMNLDASWNDGTFLRCYFDTLHALTGKPILITEFYAAATENRSGNNNSAGFFLVAPTQAQRAEAAHNTLAALTRLPYVIGTDWFQYSDEPQHGRDDGENFNFGLVDIYDVPYDGITSMFSGLHPEKVRAQSSPSRANASSGIPPAPKDPFFNFTYSHALKEWDRERGFVPPNSQFPLSDLYVCWSSNALYLGLYSVDVVEPAYYRNSSVPKNERPLWSVRVDGRDVVQARLGAGREAFANNPSCRIESISAPNVSVRFVAALELSAKQLNRDSFKAGDTIHLDCALLTHARAYRYDWKGTFTLRD